MTEDELVKKMRWTSSHLRRFAGRCRTYGMTITDFLALWDAQDGRCAGCEKKFSWTRVPHIDHDHDSGQVRGLLCSPCNVLIGTLHDNADLLRRLSNHILTPIADRVFDAPRRHVDSPPEGS